METSFQQKNKTTQRSSAAFQCWLLPQISIKAISSYTAVVKHRTGLSWLIFLSMEHCDFSTLTSYRVSLEWSCTSTHALALPVIPEPLCEGRSWLKKHPLNVNPKSFFKSHLRLPYELLGRLYFKYLFALSHNLRSYFAWMKMETLCFLLFNY